MQKIFSLLKNCGLSASVAIILLGCAAGPRDQKYSPDSSIASHGSGIVFGKMCEGGAFTFVNNKTGEKIEYIGG